MSSREHGRHEDVQRQQRVMDDARSGPAPTRAVVHWRPAHDVRVNCGTAGRLVLSCDWLQFVSEFVDSPIYTILTNC